MSDIAAFLTARLDEDEQVARDATPGPWLADYGDDDEVYTMSDPVRTSEANPDVCDYAVIRYIRGGARDRTEANMVYIARHDPARVLADIAAKRRILARHRNFDFPFNPDGDGPGDYAWTAHCDCCSQPWPCPDLRDLASQFADHPDYKEAWTLDISPP